MRLRGQRRRRNKLDKRQLPDEAPFKNYGNLAKRLT